MSAFGLICRQITCDECAERPIRLRDHVCRLAHSAGPAAAAANLFLSLAHLTWNLELS